MIHILGIESSCDETAASIVAEDGTIASSVIFSQIAQHQEFGGVVPEIAARAHLEKVEYVIKTALSDAKMTLNDIDGIAVTAGPGLIGGVIVGLTTAKTMALALNKPFIAINHLEGHALTPRLCHKTPFPYLLLLASGGHTQILLAKDIGDYEIIGTTIDDAAGEAFDKVAKMLGLGYPGGPILEKMATTGDASRFKLPTPLKGKPGCDFSFSGLKTAVRILIEKQQTLTEQDKADICASFQNAVISVIEDRLKNAIKMYKERFPQGNNLVVAGGVAANQAIATALTNIASKNKLIFSAPPMNLCTDNAAMIAWAGVERFKKGQRDSFDIAPRSRWPLAETKFE